MAEIDQIRLFGVRSPWLVRILVCIEHAFLPWNAAIVGCKFAVTVVAGGAFADSWNPLESSILVILMAYCAITYPVLLNMGFMDKRNFFGCLCLHDAIAGLLR